MMQVLFDSLTASSLRFEGADALLKLCNSFDAMNGSLGYLVVIVACSNVSKPNYDALPLFGASRIAQSFTLIQESDDIWKAPSGPYCKAIRASPGISEP
jgi:hypothetical protein